MKITLAYPYEGHDPDDTIDVDEGTARELVNDGKARYATEDEKPAKKTAAKKTAAKKAAAPEPVAPEDTTPKEGVTT